MTATTTQNAKPETPTKGEIEDPVHGVSYSCREGEDLWVYSWMGRRRAPARALPPASASTGRRSRARCGVKLDGRWRDLVACRRSGRGLAQHAPRAQEHERKPGPPATGSSPPDGLEEFLTESARAAREGLYNGRNLPTSLRGGWLARFSRSTIATRP